jgi:tetratricopeptide (TPR) repeat protein
MLRHFIFLSMLALGTAFIASKLTTPTRVTTPSGITQYLENKKRSAISCGPDWEAIDLLTDEMDIPLIPGAGNYSWKISTASDSAQLYFNQGINMYYSFHIIEAMASFKKAAKFDPECAMLYWAQALSYGPNINDLGYVASPEALKASAMAAQFAGNASPVEKALIDAMHIRYTADSADVTRSKLNAAYTAMMKKANAQFPSIPDVNALYADAMMLEHPWDLWNNDGTPKPWTPLIQSTLEKLLAAAPNHPGANHYYIHVMEPSPFAAKALPSADILGKLTPGLSHTIHMPSHIYLRTGHYNEGVTVNENAVNAYQKVLKLYSPVASSDFLYVIHNLHFKTNVAMLAGRAADSRNAATETINSIPVDYLSAPAPMGSAVQYIYMVPALVQIRFGNWEQLLSAEKPGEKLIYANILYHFGRGMAQAHKANLEGANKELAQMQQLMKDSGLAIPFGIFSPALEGAKVAESLLTGSIALAAKKFTAANTAFEQAVATEENMVYTEPRDWLLNPKPYLGNAYLEAGNYKAAEAIFRKDLLVNNENGWALYGLYKALLGQKKNAEAGAMLERYQKAFSQADVKLTAAVF